MNDIFKYLEKFTKENHIDEVIVAMDSTNIWRREYFPWYKKQRKISRKSDEKKMKAKDHWFRWDKFYDIQAEFISTIKEFLPVKVLKVNGAEADDIVAILSRHIKGPKYIVTTDTDYIQLLQNDDVHIYSPMKKAYMQSSNPKKEMLVKIMSGDDSDFIPSIDDKHTYKSEFLQYCVLEGMAENEKFAQIKLDENENLYYDMNFKFMEKYGISSSRRRRFTKKNALFHIDNNTIKELLSEDKKLKEKFKLNNILVNLEMQPDYIKSQVLSQYEEYELPKLNFLKFCVKHKFKHFLESNNFSTLLKQLSK